MNIALILAGGIGSRAGGLLPKQFQEVDGERIIWRSVKAFKKFDPDCRIVLAVHPRFLERWDELFLEEESKLGLEIFKTSGGKSRIESVKNGLAFIGKTFGEPSEFTVFIHDSARPAVTPELIERGRKAVDAGVGAVPVVPLADSLRMLTEVGSCAVDRSMFVAVQTPQVFCYSDIKRAYDALKDEEVFTDDASVAENAGIAVITFPGDPDNIKITNPSDFRRIQSF